RLDGQMEEHLRAWWWWWRRSAGPCARACGESLSVCPFLRSLLLMAGLNWLGVQPARWAVGDGPRRKDVCEKSSTYEKLLQICAIFFLFFCFLLVVHF